MRFNELTETDLHYFSTVYHNKELSWDTRLNSLASHFECSTRTIDSWAKRLRMTESSQEESPQYKIAQARAYNKKSKRFIISWAQNNTKVHSKFVQNMKAYADFINADIHIIAGRYKNPTSIWTSSQQEEESWDQEVVPYLDANRHNIHKYVSIMSDVKIHPTAVNPMTGMEGMSGVNSCVIGSPKVQMEMVPVLEANVPKMMVTTGACTVKNYTDSKAGKKGEFHHTLGFVIVEIKNGEVFFIRQVTATDEGSFCDLFYRVSHYSGESQVNRINKVSALVWGDLHYGHHDPKVFNSTIGLMETLNPDHVVLHDVFDGKSISHHEEKDPFLQYQKEMDGTNSLKKEIEELLEGLASFNDYNTVIVRSNHDDFVDRWLKNTDWRRTVTPKNSLEYMQYSSAILSGEAPNGVIPWVINKQYPHFVTLGRSDSYIVNGWELGQHGDIGSNGSRGSLQQFRKLNHKIVVGHYHSPGRKDGALSVGTSTHLRVGYNIGASAWLQSHVIIHEDGKAQHINFIKGEYTTLK
jgi:hypothetical protein